MSMRIEATEGAGPLALLMVPLVSIAMTAVAGMVLFGLLGYDGGAVVSDIFVAPLVNSYKWADLALRAAPLTIIAAGLAICYRAGVWNIGAEGQYVIGAIGGTGVALWTQGQTGFWILPAMGMASIAAGAGWAAIPALLRTRFGVSEILSSLMLSYIAMQVLYYLVVGPWANPVTMGIPATPYFGPAQTLPMIAPGSFLHVGVPLAVAVALVVWVLMSRALFGFQVRVLGLSAPAARYSGVAVNRITWAVMLWSGALAGLAGLLEAAGPYGQLSVGFPAGLGFTAIIVVYLARLNPLGVVPAALVMALIAVGGEMAQTSSGVPSSAVGIFQAMMLVFLLVGDAAFRLRIGFAGATVLRGARS